MLNSLIVIAHNIRSLHNVGAIFRTSEGAGVDKVYLTGYTGTPPRPQIAKVALGSEERVTWEHHKNISTLISTLKAAGYTIVSLEQDPRSIPYNIYKPKPKTALIIGNEVRGVSKQLRDKSDAIIELPMKGKRKSLNVSVAFGIAIYEMSSKSKR